MATPKWPPLRDAELAPWANNFSAKITAAPTDYGLVAADATQLATLLAAFLTALALTDNPATRTAVTVAQKDLAKANLLAFIRFLAKRVQAAAGVLPDEKIALGLPVHKTTPSAIPAPVTRPVLSVVGGSVNRTLTVRLVDETTPDRRAKPFGVDGAEVYSYVPAVAGETPPADLEKWRFEGIAKRATFDADFDAADVGKSAYVIARWFSPRGEPGPASAPVVATVAA